MVKLGGASIKYPELTKKNVQFFDDQDKVHLTQLGNDIFLYRLQYALKTY